MTPRLFLLILLFAVAAAAGAPEFDTILYGVSYYHEYMPYERLDKDVELMKKAGINFVRLGESTWSSWEPREGEFEFAWMERTLDRLHKAGIKVVLGTPTYSIPPWLYRRHPEIIVTQLGARQPLGKDRHQAAYFETKHKGAYGVRQNMDLTHPTYRWYAERVIRQVVSHFKDHPAIIGFQVDNETHPNSSGSRSLHADFVERLQEKFGSVERLNKIWGFAYWGQLLSGWEDLPAREGILNPGYKLEWDRFQRQTVTDFLRWQAEIVREYARPEHFVTHNWPGGIRTNVDQIEVAKFLDVVAVNPYHPVQDRLSGEFISFCGDLTRSQKQANYLVTETNAQTIGWDSRTQFPPYDGQLRLSAYSHVSSGANMVAYWHWHSLHYGQETYWKGLLSHDLEPNRLYKEAARIAGEFRTLGPKLVNFVPDHDVAILVSVDSHYGIQSMPFDDHVNYMTILHQMYGALHELNIGVDFVFAEDAGRMHDYKVVLVPPLYIASDALLNRISGYVKEGGHVVMSFKSGFANEHATVRWEKAPGPLREAAGFHYQEFSTLAAPIGLKGDPFEAGAENNVDVWAEMIIPESCETLARYDHPFFGQYPAITRNRFGTGTLTYQGTHLSAELQKQVLLDVAKMAGITCADQQLPPPVQVKHGAAGSGRPMHYYLNYSGVTQNIQYPYGAGVDLLTGKAIAPHQEVSLAPWDLIIVEESVPRRSSADRAQALQNRP